MCTHTQTCIKNLIGAWPVVSVGEAFNNSGKTSLELFRWAGVCVRLKGGGSTPGSVHIA